jgi:hypothetical protein
MSCVNDRLFTNSRSYRINRNGADLLVPPRLAFGLPLLSLHVSIGHVPLRRLWPIWNVKKHQTHEDSYRHQLWNCSDVFGHDALSGKFVPGCLLGTAIISQDLASTLIRAESDCLYLVFGAECQRYFGGCFLDSRFEAENMRFYDKQPDKSLEPEPLGVGSTMTQVLVCYAP